MNQILISSDGKYYSKTSVPVNRKINAVAFTEFADSNVTRYVAMGDYGAIIYSKNGINWEIADSKTKDNLLSVALGNNMFLTIGEYGTIASYLEAYGM